MNSFRKHVVIAAFVTGMAAYGLAQDKPAVTTMAGSKLASAPGLPQCTTLSVQRGDPSKGAAVLLLKATAGCTVPWHWHSPNENLMVVSGKGKMEMKDAAMTVVGPGDYIYMPAKHPHQFTCTNACTLFDVTDGVFDIHYIDIDGKEIPPEQALATKKPAAKKK